MKKLLSLAVISIIVLFNFSCRENTKPMLPAVSGSAYEVLVVMPKYQWEGAMGDTLRTRLAYPIPFFAQEEPILTVKSIPPDALKGVFQTFRNLISVQIGTEYSKPEIFIQRDGSAKTQIHFILQAPDQAGISELLRQQGENMVRTILTTEMERTVALNKKYYDKKIYDQLQQHHKLFLGVPQGYAIQVDSGNFVWIEQLRGDNILGLLVWYYPYRDKNQLSKETLLAKRNEILKRNVPGKDPGSYMTTEKIADPIYEVLSINNRTFYQLSGLWTVERGFMGGPFVNITSVDTAGRRVVTVDGFVFAPNQKKRNWLYQLQSIAYTMSFP